MFQKYIAIGRLTRDPETRNVSDTTVTSFVLAVDDGFGDKKKTHFVQCSQWGDRGQRTAQYTKKGHTVCIEGRWQSNKKEDKIYWEVRVDDVKFLTSKAEAQTMAAQNGDQSQSQPQQQGGYQPQQGGYQQPHPQQQGGYAPQPQQGGYQQPQAPQNPQPAAPYGNPQPQTGGFGDNNFPF
jgi:single-strand DNA-binding protein